MFDPSTNFLNVHEWAYGVTEIIHILSMTAAIGFIALIDLRLLGLRIGGATSERLLRVTAIGTLIGLVIAITTGFLVFSTDPIRYFEHPTMRLKIAALVVAIVFNYTIHTRAARGGYLPGVQRAAAALSLLLWVTVVFGGIFYAFS